MCTISEEYSHGAHLTLELFGVHQHQQQQHQRHTVRFCPRFTCICYRPVPISLLANACGRTARILGIRLAEERRQQLLGTPRHRVWDQPPPRKRVLPSSIWAAAKPRELREKALRHNAYNSCEDASMRATRICEAKTCTLTHISSLNIFAFVAFGVGVLAFAVMLC